MNLEGKRVATTKKKRYRRRKQKKERSFADYIVFVSIFMVAAFTLAAFVLQFKGLMEVSPTLTTCWFAFWGAEIISLAAIRTSKVKHNYDKEPEQKDDEENAG